MSQAMDQAVSPVTHAVLSIGANLGDRIAALQGALDALSTAAEVSVVAVSPVFETDPVGGPHQPMYLNAVVVVATTLAPRDLLALAQRIESDWQRTREVRWGPRTLDIDIVDIPGFVSDDVELTVPHPRAAERAFVLVPWRCVQPDAELASLGPIAALDCDDSSVRPTDLRLEVR